ncbi:YgaP family membrane protein [Psychromonas sp. L1A2]|jgi:hypothetical protein|uniref:YgaP family membrane protein n=1 Tax=Psychromonas sp. L1A2 TaxID=2686356 RepID=UPI00191500B9|nr:DUF2892 domain-containing protein [Psychromonas sp. L1A2]
MIKENVGGVDRTLRIIVGAVLIGIGLWYLSWWGAIGVVLMLTALLGWCPVYLPFGVSTSNKEKKTE